MKFIKFTYVDSVTGTSVVKEPAINGPTFPNVLGLEFVWARESKYPTNTPEFFGTCPTTSDTQIDGVLGVFGQADWEGMRTDEAHAREVKAAQGKSITRLAFRSRFTQEEKTMLELAALDDPSAPMPQRLQAAGLRAYLQDLAAAEYVNLSDPITVAGVQALEVGGLLALGRATEVLSL